MQNNETYRDWMARRNGIGERIFDSLVGEISFLCSGFLLGTEDKESFKIKCQAVMGDLNRLSTDGTDDFISAYTTRQLSSQFVVNMGEAALKETDEIVFEKDQSENKN